jgi:Putative peptidoglycan binding domain
MPLWSPADERGYIDIIRIDHYHGGTMAADASTTTRICRVLMGLAVLWGMIGFSGARSWAGDHELDRATLRGLPGIEVVIEQLTSEVEQAGLTVQQLRTDVELRLRQAGIPLLSKEERFRVPGAPYLYVRVTAMLHSPSLRLFAYPSGVALNQRVYLEHDTSRLFAPTWYVETIGTVGATNIHYLRALTRDQVDQFINAYLSVNPRPVGTLAPSSASPRRNLMDQVTERFIRQVQERLQTIGFNPGSIDGAMGPQTRDALRWFQNTKGLRATGDLDDPTLNALGIR